MLIHGTNCVDKRGFSLILQKFGFLSVTLRSSNILFVLSNTCIYLTIPTVTKSSINAKKFY